MAILALELNELPAPAGLSCTVVQVVHQVTLGSIFTPGIYLM